MFPGTEENKLQKSLVPPALRMSLLILPGCWQHQHHLQTYPPCHTDRCHPVPAWHCLRDTEPLPRAKSRTSEKDLYVQSLNQKPVVFSVTRTRPVSYKDKFHGCLSQVQHLNSAEFTMFPCVLWPTVNAEEFLLGCFKTLSLSLWNTVCLCFPYIQRTFNLLLPS